MGTLPQWIERRKRDVGEIVDAFRAALEEFEGESFGQLEERALALADEVVRSLLESRLQILADELTDEVWIDDGRYRRHQPGRVKYHGLTGPLFVERWTYRRVGERNGVTVVPLELEAGLMERATPALAYSVAEGYAEGTSREYVRRLRAARRNPPSRSTVERMAKRLGQRFHEKLLEAEPWIRRGERLPEQATAVVLGLDRTSIPMEEDLGVAKTEYGKRPKERRHGKPVEVHYRMGFVGTVTITDGEAQPLVVRRYAVAAHEGPRRIVHRMVADVRRALRQRPELPVQVVQDRAPELWTQVTNALDAEPTVVDWHETLDRYHLEERLATILDILVGDQAKRCQIQERWRRSLNRNDRALEHIRRWIDRQVPDWQHKRWREVQPHRSYLDDYWGGTRFHYASLRERGMMMGSGVTEGACKSLINQRTKRSGQRWRARGIEAVLSLRTALHSDRLPRVWRHMRRDYSATVNRAA